MDSVAVVRLFTAAHHDQPDTSWQDSALCAQTDPEAFFPDKGGSTREAKRTCSGCEVRAECLEYALATDERFGVWGGLSERERRRIKRGPTNPHPYEDDDYTDVDVAPVGAA
jgi:WhiB family redox-sensing transcriptional regulator